MSRLPQFIQKHRFFLIGCLILLGVDYLRTTDPTDKSRLYRSGMSFYIDYGTGCHYLAGGGFFGKQVLIPRVDKKGNHICEKDN